VLLSVEGTDKNQLDACQEIMVFASVLSHCSLLRNPLSKPTGVLGLFKEKSTVGSRFFGAFPSDHIAKATKDVTYISSFTVAIPIHGLIQNFLDWCCHLHSSCGSAKHR
jgi:hypothetical protein